MGPAPILAGIIMSLPVVVSAVGTKHQEEWEKNIEEHNARAERERIRRAQAENEKERERLAHEREQLRVAREQRRVEEEQEEQQRQRIAEEEERLRLEATRLKHEREQQEQRIKELEEEIRQRKNQELENQGQIGAVQDADVIGLENIRSSVVSFDYVGMVQNVFAFGPPGCGKTFVSKLFATKLDFKFVIVEATQVQARNSQDSCDYVKSAFTKARSYIQDTNRPCILFFDDFDTIDMDSNGAMKGLFLHEMDGLRNGSGVDSKLMCVAISNHPWKIDTAIRSRFQGHYYFPLPSPELRRAFVEKYLSNNVSSLTQADLQEFVQNTDMYSFRELRGITNYIQAGKALKHVASSPLHAPPTVTELAQVVVDADILRDAVKQVRPQAVAADIARFEEFARGFAVRA